MATADLAVQLQRQPVQLKGLIRASEPVIGIGEVVRRLGLAHPVADLAPDGQRPFEAVDSLIVAGESERVPEVVQDPRLTLAVADPARALQRDAFRAVAPAAEELEERGR